MNQTTHEQPVTTREQLNNSIRDLASKARIAITKGDDAVFASLTQDMILAAEFCDSDFSVEIKNHIYDACFDISEAKMPRHAIAKTFYENVIHHCKLFLN